MVPDFQGHLSALSSNTMLVMEIARQVCSGRG